jgi:PAS domain-containing protein
VELARLRSHHARWRAALLDSLHEAFFVLDEDGAVVEINAAFTDIMGFGPEELPFSPCGRGGRTRRTTPRGARCSARASSA